MKKFLAFVSIILVLFIAACGTTDDKSDDESRSEIKVGASSTPHAEILEEAKPFLAEKGITLIIEEYTDFILPNDDLASGDIDANYFQHEPYLLQMVEDTGYKLESIGDIHIEPMGIYSKTITNIDDLEDGTEVILSNSVSDHGRVLALLEAGGLIKLDDSVDKASAKIEDIVDNPNNLEFSPDYEPAFLPELYDSETDVLLAINTNYAIGADLNPVEDALIIEGSESVYANIIAVRSEDTENEGLQALVDVLKSEEIQDFITEKYDGAVVPF